MAFRVRQTQTIHGNQLNRSSAKQKYTFCKEKRFRPDKINDSYKYYDIPKTNALNSRSFCTSERKSILVTKEKQSLPSPDRYNPEDLKVTKNMISFAPSRQKCKNYDALKPKEGPGPGIYDPKYDTLSNNLKYSMGVKLPNPKPLNMYYPGPGKYNNKSWLQKMKILSTQKYKGGAIFANSNSERVIFSGQTFNLPLYNNRKTIRGEETLNKTGACFGKSRRFQKRQKTDSSMPGPGSYNHFSQFF